MSKEENPELKAKLNPSTEKLVEWETPQLFVENMETITEGGIFNINDQDDAFYHT